jgi:hypothetical protein
MGDYSPNISLYLMDQKGYTNYCLGQSIEKFTPEMFQELHSKYLILLENKWLEKDYLKPFLKYKMGEHGNISIFDLRPFMQLEKK